MKKHPYASLWRSPLPADTEGRLRDIFSNCGEMSVFFRADDIGRPEDHLFHQLMELFFRQRMPLCPAVVPTWIDGNVWQTYSRFQPASSQWCWHQHGYSHSNHQLEGKKAEFGDAREQEAVFSDLAAGKRKLEDILGDDFLAVFTPPWNRCSRETLASLCRLEFKAVSRSRGASPPVPSPLVEYPINVDLHTRKEEDPVLAWDALYREMHQAADCKRMGIMLHHLVMNRESFLFLELLLKVLKMYAVPCLTFRELLHHDAA